MKYGKPILALLSLFGANPSTILRCWRISKRNCRLLYVHSNRCHRCFRIQTSGFTSYDTWCSALFSFQRTPAIPSGAVRFSWISFYILPHPFRLVKNFLNLFSQALKTSGIRLSAAFALVAVCRRLVIYYTVRCSLSRSFFASFHFFIFTPIICARADLSRADRRSFPGNRRSPARSAACIAGAGIINA